MLALDRQGFNDIFHEGKALISGAMLPAPYGNWGMPPEVLSALPGYSGDLAARQAARAGSWRASGMARASRGIDNRARRQ
jgi:hypothetical protein